MSSVRHLVFVELLIATTLLYHMASSQLKRNLTTPQSLNTSLKSCTWSATAKNNLTRNMRLSLWTHNGTHSEWKSGLWTTFGTTAIALFQTASNYIGLNEAWHLLTMNSAASLAHCTLLATYFCTQNSVQPPFGGDQTKPFIHKEYKVGFWKHMVCSWHHNSNS